VHCVQDTDGAAFHAELKLPAETIVVTKGTRFDQDQYSAFDQTGFAEELRRKGVKRLFVGGLAEDVCVHASALDARKAGFEVQVIGEATRA
ncbi:isochorismatase family protein, partial [Tritonibacter sp. SIMBA_163]|uniref:isochorismatase family protein n=1 Tax=Tritonibacter sp. SIMBA_163 TaxID=3080868 RepID=UPI00397FB7A9